MTVTIEVINYDHSVNVSSFVVQCDQLHIVECFIDTLRHDQYDFIVYHDGVPVDWVLYDNQGVSV